MIFRAAVRLKVLYLALGRLGQVGLGCRSQIDPRKVQFQHINRSALRNRL